MKTISDRELWKDGGRILHEVENGESFAVTSRGEVVAALVPAGDGRDLRCVRPAKGSRNFSKIARRVVSDPSAMTLDELREDG